ncbi:hypothetical protein EHE19_009265 [Ruminiclostridium herbifermentans]|uniref:Uncharacterized protein n=1 Tax=Ruminiclostridium herbifermentans TaxID=2488810 RepID=A0A4U7JJ02_9FIRM|nr:hypothetical protein [Ruminiclostridium herbifermentans]QNU68563.1 hypothetical protein EHE19_009265 [Ruminiclostridium herbifermentans]
MNNRELIKGYTVDKFNKQLVASFANGGHKNYDSFIRFNMYLHSYVDLGYVSIEFSVKYVITKLTRYLKKKINRE